MRFGPLILRYEDGPLGNGTIFFGWVWPWSKRARFLKDQKRRELAASVLEDGGYPKIADKIRAGMRASNWKEDLVDPGLLLDLLDRIEH